MKKRDTNNTFNINLYLRKYDIGRITIYSSNFTSSFIVKKKKKESKQYSDICTPVFTAVLFTIAKKWK